MQNCINAPTGGCSTTSASLTSHLVLKTGSRELYVFMAQEHGQLLAGYWYRRAGRPDHRRSTTNCWLLVSPGWSPGPPHEHGQLLAGYLYHRVDGQLLIGYWFVSLPIHWIMMPHGHFLLQSCPSKSAPRGHFLLQSCPSVSAPRLGSALYIPTCAKKVRKR